jgi:hypothetical protein
MQILGTGTRDVEILAPLKIKSLLTTIEQAVVIGGSAPVEATGLYVSNNAVVNRNLTVNQNLTVSGDMTVTGKGPWYCAGRVNTGTGGIFSNYGRVGFTTTRNGVGQITITMNSAHPENGNYAVFASSSRPFTIVENSISGLGLRTSTSFQMTIRSSDYSTLGPDTNGLTFMVV